MRSLTGVATVADFMLLDEGEILEGYFDGFHQLSEPPGPRSRSYWHGWRNGQVDSGTRPPDRAHAALAADFERLSQAC